MLKLKFIQKPKDFLEILWGTLILFIFSILPILIAFIGGYFEELIKGHPVHEGNSAIITIAWLAIITLPAGIIISTPLFSLCIYNGFLFFKKRNELTKFD